MMFIKNYLPISKKSWGTLLTPLTSRQEENWLIFLQKTH